MNTIEILYSHFLQSSGVCTDTRNLQKGQIFFALKGETFNGNLFALDALKAGAMLAVADDPALVDSDGVFLVPDSLIMLQSLALYHRKHLPYPIIALTGSNGKTSSKELIARVLQSKYKVGFTRGNLNNHIGVPQTLLSFGPDLDFGIVEMGANHSGEISLLSSLALPDFGFITNIGKAHLEGFGDIEGVFRAKTEMIPWLEKNGGTFFLNADDPFLQRLEPMLPVITYGSRPGCQHRGEMISADPLLEIRIYDEQSDALQIQTQLTGVYNFSNVLVAYAIGRYFGVDPQQIKDAVETYIPANNRSQLQSSQRNTLILDAYNANPSSMESALASFRSLKSNQPKLLILGDMFELGVSSSQEHIGIIQKVRDLGFENAIFIGPLFSEWAKDFPQYRFITTTVEAQHMLEEEKPAGYLVLLKGSRGMKLELLIPYL
jgi:UDP-N-acetylmuramoyl-tripeptide--D-alanyl-D-alanine ligase